jgi:hypothetical protein
MALPGPCAVQHNIYKHLELEGANFSKEVGVVFEMADVPMPRYQKFWTDRQAKLKFEYWKYVGKYPDADSLMKQVHNVLCDIEDLVQYTPALLGESTEWTSVVNTAEENRASYCKVLTGDTI